MDNVEFEGLEELNDKIEALLDVKKVNKALGECCALVERSAKQKAPKDTGALRRSITSKVENFEGIVYTPLEYAPYIMCGV